MSNISNKYIISIAGSKGGSSKSLTGHILAHGLSIGGFGAILATTDLNRNVRDDSNRKYSTYSAQDDEKTAALISHFIDVDIDVTSFVIIDGGASSRASDAIHAERANLVLVPFLKDVEDIEVAIDDVASLKSMLSPEDFSNVRLLPSRFPTNQFAIKSTIELFDSMFSDEYKQILMKPVVEMSAAARLNRPSTEKLPSDVNNLARALANQVLLELGEDPFQYRYPRRS